MIGKEERLRKFSFIMDASGEIRAKECTKLYKGSYGFVLMQLYVPVTQNRTKETYPKCTVFRTATNTRGEKQQFGEDVYDLIYVEDVELDGMEYMLFERLMPKAFTETEGYLYLIFNYCELKTSKKLKENDETENIEQVISRLTSNPIDLKVCPSDVAKGDSVDEIDESGFNKLNEINTQMKMLEKKIVDFLELDCTNVNGDVNGDGDATVEIDGGHLKFSNLKGKKGDAGTIEIGEVENVEFGEPLEVTNSGTSSEAILNFKIPQGKPASVKIGEVKTLPPESNALVENVGTENEPILNFSLPTGIGFRINKTYKSVAEMNESFDTDGVPLYGFVIIDSNVNDEDNAKLFIKNSDKYEYLTDLSGAQGIKGEKGDKGDKGEAGIMMPVEAGFFRLEVRDDGHLYVMTADDANVALSIDKNEESPTYGHLILQI